MFAFYRTPKAFFQSDEYKDLSAEAKILYGILLDRVSLSAMNEWKDEAGRVFIYCTLESIQEALGCAHQKATKLLRELEKAGLLERKKQGLGKPDIIYVMNFADNLFSAFKSDENHHSGELKISTTECLKSSGNNTDKNYIDINNTNPILSADEDRMGYEKYFMEQLNIEALKQDYPYDREMIDGIMDLILDVVCSKRKIICIAGDVKSVNVVKGRFMKLNMEHIRYVMNCMQENTTKIRSIKQYMLAALYNAPATIDSYYRAEVNHDMAEGKI